MAVKRAHPEIIWQTQDSGTQRWFLNCGGCGMAFGTSCYSRYWHPSADNANAAGNCLSRHRSRCPQWQYLVHKFLH